MEERALRDAALSGDPAAMRLFIREVLPVVQARAARALARRRGGSGRDVRQEVEDFSQEVFAALFAEDCRVLRAWDETRGLSLLNFCGLVAEREIASILRSGRRSPWTEAATEAEELERETVPSDDAQSRIESKQELTLLVERLRESLSPRGLLLFERLIVNEESPAQVCESTGMSSDAVYAWRSRIGKLVRRLASEIAGSDAHVAACVSGEDAPARRTGKGI